MTIRVLVADDQPIVRSGFASLLSTQRDIEVVAEAGDGEEAVRLAAEHRPDLALLDIRMPVMDGIEATRHLVRDASGIKVLMLTTFGLDEYVYGALAAGASGFLLKDATLPELLNAVRVVAGGEALLAPSVTRRLIAAFVRPGRPVAPARELSDLTEREKEVLILIARGLSNAEIAAQLALTHNTVKSHINRLFRKFDLRDRAQAVILAYETRLVVPLDPPAT
ncbi:MAG: response regulator transcription factor [Streptomyces sp.]|nr:response regulator transcription factor [Streptomyces sp.]NUT42132.1 response regulator transcription factor [Thermoactinospora sp.]